MRIHANNDEGTWSGDAGGLGEEEIADLNRLEFTRAYVRREIDNLNISAEAKHRLHAMSELTIDAATAAGKVVIRIGRKILDIVVWCVKNLPNATFGVIFGLVAAWLIAQIPIIGFLIGPLVKVVLPAFGGVTGLTKDLQEMVHRRCRQFTSLRTEQS